MVRLGTTAGQVEERGRGSARPVDAREALRESEERFRSAFENAAIGMALVAPDGRFLRVNRSLCEILGRSSGELLALTFQELTHPDDLDTDLGYVRRMLDGRIRTYQMEKRYFHADGRVVWALLSVSLVRGEDGGPKYFIAQIEDITERKRAEETLRQRDAVFRAVAACGERLLRADDWNDAVGDVLRELGEASRVSRAYLFRRHEDPEGRTRVSQLCEWSAPGVESHADDPSLQDHLPEAIEAGWFEKLRAGRVAQAHIRELGAVERRLFDLRGIRSLVLVPVFVAGQWWGFLGFDECRREREWTPAETETLRTAAGLLGAAIERRLASQRLRESEERYRRLVETLPLTTYVDRVDDDVTALFISPQIEAALGYTTEEWLADPGFFRRVVHPDDRGEMLEGEWPDDDGPHRVEYRMIAKDGSVRWFLDEYTIHRDERGERSFAQGYLLDITERKEMEEELRRANQLLNALIEASPIGILGIDLDARVWLWNPAAEAMFGWTRDEVIGQRVPFVPSEKEHEFQGFLKRARHGESWTNTELTRQRKDGSTIVIAASSAPIRGPDGSHRGLVSVVVDVTEQKKLQAQLLRASRLEAVGRLAGGIAHDFNNLLTAISGYGEFLLEALDEHDPLRRDVEEIRRAADLAAALIRQLLAFSRRQMLQPRSLDLNEVVRETETLLQRLIGEDVRLETRLASGLPPVRADPAQIEQIIVNLAVNARDAMPEGGRLSITTELSEDGEYVRLIAADTGCGMDEHTRLHAFEPFFTTKDPAHGTGLGLSMVFGIVTQSGGRIEVESEVGQGSTFVVELPADRSAAPDGPTEPDGPPQEPGQGTILLVEDEEIVRALAERVLTNAGYTVLAVATGGEAIALAEREGLEIDLLLTDVVMPGLAGPQLARRLTELRPGLRVLYTSGYAEEDVWRDDAGGDGFVAKPFTPELLRRKVAEVLGTAAR